MSLEAPKIKFFENCKKILDSLGEESKDIPLSIDCDGHTYSDEVISISASDDRLYFEVYRQSNLQQIIVMNNGTCIRFRGEFIYLEDHVNKIINKLVDVV